MKKLRRLTSIGLLLAMTFSLAGCSSQSTGTNDTSTSTSTSTSDNPDSSKEEDILCGIMNWQEPNDLDIFPTPALGEWKQYSSLTSMILDLNAGNIEYLLVPASVANYLKAQDDSLTIAPGGAGVPTEIRMAVRSDDAELHQKLQDGIKTLQEDGSLDSLIETYITNVSTDGSGSQEKKEDAYVVGVTGDLPPLDYVAADGTPAGFNVALMNAISDRMDVPFTFTQVEADARLSALSSGKIDVIFWYGNVQGYSSEKDEILVTDQYYTDTVYYVTKSFDMNRILEAMKAQ